MAFAYILRCHDGTLYSGAAKDLTRRLRQHQDGKASSYTAARRPVELVWHREVESWGEALREEHRLKKLDRSAKLALIAVFVGATHASPSDTGVGTPQGDTSETGPRDPA